MNSAAFGRLCVETHTKYIGKVIWIHLQPPSGGCVLKLTLGLFRATMVAAAFGRLCVETPLLWKVLTPSLQPPSGGCVLKRWVERYIGQRHTSRLRAAVC